MVDVPTRHPTPTLHEPRIFLGRSQLIASLQALAGSTKQRVVGKSNALALIANGVSGGTTLLAPGGELSRLRPMSLFPAESMAAENLQETPGHSRCRGSGRTKMKQAIEWKNKEPVPEAFDTLFNKHN